MDDSLLSPRHRVVDTPLLDPADRAEVVHMLTTICTLREKQTKSLPPVMINIYQAMALLHLVLKDHPKVRGHQGTLMCCVVVLYKVPVVCSVSTCVCAWEGEGRVTCSCAVCHVTGERVCA